jgi:methionyl-tRNA formyltransferase
MIRLFLMGKKGLVSLENLNPKYHSSISQIVIGKDKSLKKDYAKEIFLLAKKLKINSCFRSDFKDSKHEGLLIAIGWRWLIKSKCRLFVLHDSILPKYRGFNPLVTALINGDPEIGVTAIEATEEFDSGAIINQKNIGISHPIKIGQAIDKISLLYAEILNEVIQDYQNDDIVYSQQNENLASYSLWRDENDYEINWTLPADVIIRFIYALSFPYLGAKTKINGTYVRIFDAEEVNDVVIINRTPGKVIFKSENEYTIVCGKGLIKISEFYDANGEQISFKNKFRLRFGV